MIGLFLKDLAVDCLRCRQPAGLMMPHRRLHRLIAVHRDNLPRGDGNLKPSRVQYQTLRIRVGSLSFPSHIPTVLVVNFTSMSGCPSSQSLID